MDFFALYIGLLIMLVGLVSVIKPLRYLRIRNRRQGAAILLLGLVLVIVGARWPVTLSRSNARPMRMDEFMPVYHFHEVHTVQIHAPSDQIFRAIKAVTPKEIRFLHLFFGIRHLPGRLLCREQPSILTAFGPLLEVMIRSGFYLLADEADREIVLGTIMQYTADGTVPTLDTPRAFSDFAPPSHVKATINFHLQEESDGWCQLRTETRVLATDPSTLKKFAVYWRIIYPGSALLRKTTLVAVKRRAEYNSQ